MTAVNVDVVIFIFLVIKHVRHW